MEIETGLASLRLRGADRKADRIGTLSGSVKEGSGDAVPGFDKKIATSAGRLIAIDYASGRRPDLADALIGATAEAHGLVLVTRNLRHFETFGVEAIDPFII